jgi:hypothetical protein
MKPLLSAFVYLGLAAHCIAQNARAVGTLFQVDFTTNNGGGCQYFGQANMQEVLQDSLDLLGIGVQLVTDYGNNVEEARRLLDSFFKQPKGNLNAQQLNAILSEFHLSPKSSPYSSQLMKTAAYSTVANWVQNGGPVNALGNNLVPNLYCYDNWLTKYSMSDPAFDTTGQQIKNVITGALVRILDIGKYLLLQQQESDKLPAGEAAVPVCTCYYTASFLRTY